MACPAGALMLPYLKATDDQDANKFRQLEAEKLSTFFQVVPM